ncbi:MAG: hypothetical protein SZ59_C0001G0196 [candidate division TM6 bacterium GW2011_GWF2_28_16]|nr:MAG: hypothetical protein SZ59_C0001G0196 [candidate division TM6 bacterium GW2011_GWF2_28_16]
MKWSVNFYSDSVKKSIMDWPIGINAKFVWIIELIQDFGPNKIGMPHIKSFGQGLFEVRAKGKEGIGRAFFCIVVNKKIIILNGFIKKTQKTPLNEIELAKKRMKEVNKNG